MKVLIIIGEKKALFDEDSFNPNPCMKYSQIVVKAREKSLLEGR
jgi:hypothetical protein